MKVLWRRKDFDEAFEDLKQKSLTEIGLLERILLAVEKDLYDLLNITDLDDLISYIEEAQCRQSSRWSHLGIGCNTQGEPVFVEKLDPPCPHCGGKTVQNCTCEWAVPEVE